MYIIASYLTVPIDPKHTSRPDFMKQPTSTGKTEQIEFSGRLRPRHLKSASLILDLVNQKIVKNRVGEPFSSDNYDDLVGYFISNYPKEMEKIFQIIQDAVTRTAEALTAK